jgi:hypothetical protein
MIGQRYDGVIVVDDAAAAAFDADVVVVRFDGRWE